MTPWQFAGLAEAIDRRKKLLAMLSATLLAMVPWMQISKAAADNISISLAAILSTIAAGIGLHLIFLAFNTAAVNSLKLGGEESSTGRVYKLY